MLAGEHAVEGPRGFVAGAAEDFEGLGHSLAPLLIDTTYANPAYTQVPRNHEMLQASSSVLR